MKATNSKFKFAVTRTFAASKLTAINPRTGRSKCVAVDGPDFTATTYHETREAAEKTAKSSTYTGYAKILKSAVIVEIN